MRCTVHSFVFFVLAFVFFQLSLAFEPSLAADNVPAAPVDGPRVQVSAPPVPLKDPAPILPDPRRAGPGDEPAAADKQPAAPGNEPAAAPAEARKLKPNQHGELPSKKLKAGPPKPPKPKFVAAPVENGVPFHSPDGLPDIQHGLLKGSGPNRMVSLVVDVDYTRSLPHPTVPNQVVFKAHSFLQFAGVDAPGGAKVAPFRVELAMLDKKPGKFSGVIRGLDDTVAASGQGIGMQGRDGTKRVVMKLRETKLTNAELIDPKLGRGVAMDAWMKDPIYKYGGKTGGGAHAFTERLAKGVFGDNFIFGQHDAEVLARAKDYALIDTAVVKKTVRTFFYDTQTYTGGEPGALVRSKFSAVTSKMVRVSSVEKAVPNPDLYTPGRPPTAETIADMKPFGPTRQEVLGDAKKAGGAEAAEVAKPGSAQGEKKAGPAPKDEPAKPVAPAEEAITKMKPVPDLTLESAMAESRKPPAQRAADVQLRNERLQAAIERQYKLWNLPTEFDPPPPRVPAPPPPSRADLLKTTEFSRATLDEAIQGREKNLKVWADRKAAIATQNRKLAAAHAASLPEADRFVNLPKKAKPEVKGPGPASPPESPKSPPPRPGTPDFGEPAGSPQSPPQSPGSQASDDSFRTAGEPQSPGSQASDSTFKTAGEPQSPGSQASDSTFRTAGSELDRTDSFRSATSNPESVDSWATAKQSVASGELPRDGSVDTIDLENAVREINAAEAAGDAVPGGSGGGGGGGGGASGEGAASRALATSDSLTTVRVASNLQRIGIVSLKVLKGAGIVGAIAAPIFVIIDLAKGEYVGAAIGAAGIVAGIAAGYAATAAVEAAVAAGVESVLLSAGPVGWIVGGFVAIFFAILPFLIPKKKKPKPHRDNPQEIIQWVMFGDAKHTGNEKCRDQGNKECQALYGPGIASHAYKWDNFGGFAYLIHYNRGYAMTIPDMAKTWKVLDPKNPSGLDHETAVIDCQGDKDTCANPKFILRLELITIPYINQTADLVAKRIIPAPGGDCKLVADPINGQHYPQYNITITGRPATIACGIQESIVVNGKAISHNDGGHPTLAGALAGPQLANPADQDSAGNGGDAYIAAPAPRPFAPLDASMGLACVGKGDEAQLCFLNGTSKPHDGGWGFDLRDAESLRLPTGGAFRWGKHDDVKENQTIFANPRFKKDVHRYNPKKDKVYVTINAPVPSVVCLYADEDYEGNTQCFGAGGAYLPEAIRNQAKSVRVLGDAVAWMYADHYGDDGGTMVSTSVPDLASVAYGNNGNFSQKIVAMWIETEGGKGTVPVATVR